ncbi:MAG: magnesium/cobalt transporter CorA [Candidatus Omnitrophica bacterium]|nr:magnesium/cobalt transporter CorA [Candidatus Omnitrophota bacterium]MDD5487829.1 magnesium/cobalt transporter CorA [Candidatus Omnitrophota bacterium]
MPRLTKKISKMAGLAPGTLVHIGEKISSGVKITVMDYDEKKFTEKTVNSVEECSDFKNTSTVTWINVDGVHDLSIIEKLGSDFGLHPLLLEDIVNTGQRPKVEDYDGYIFLVLKMCYLDTAMKDVVTEQVSLVVADRYVISFQERVGDVFDPVRNRIRQGKGKVRGMGADYLAYALVDSVVDNYFAILEKFSEDTEKIEGELALDPDKVQVSDIHGLKRSTILLRRSIWPLREVLSSIQRGDFPGIKKHTKIYFRDVYDHTIQVVDTLEAMRDMVSGILEVYLSSLSNKMNEVMKVLTMFATVFIPLTFIAGVYGMNFKYMPELEWQWGYFAVLGIMGLVGVTMLVYFKRKKWL